MGSEAGLAPCSCKKKEKIKFSKNLLFIESKKMDTQFKSSLDCRLIIHKPL